MADAAISGHDHHEKPGFFTRWFMSTNHKDIGILYLIVSGFAGFISVAMTVLFACQFHPEKSARDGLQLLQNFSRWQL